MPYKSLKQEAFFHTPEGEHKVGGPAVVKEFDNATRGKKLPKYAGDGSKMKSAMKGAKCKDCSQSPCVC